MTVGYGEQKQYAADVEHPVSWIVFGLESSQTRDFGKETSAERKFTYGVDSEVAKSDTPAIAGGETYIFTTPPLTEGYWMITYRTNFGTCVTFDSFLVTLPDNSLLVDLP